MMKKIIAIAIVGMFLILSLAIVPSTDIEKAQIERKSHGITPVFDIDCSADLSAYPSINVTSEHLRSFIRPWVGGSWIDTISYSQASVIYENYFVVWNGVSSHSVCRAGAIFDTSSVKSGIHTPVAARLMFKMDGSIPADPVLGKKGMSICYDNGIINSHPLDTAIVDDYDWGLYIDYQSGAPSYTAQNVIGIYNHTVGAGGLRSVWLNLSNIDWTGGVAGGELSDTSQPVHLGGKTRLMMFATDDITKNGSPAGPSHGVYQYFSNNSLTANDVMYLQVWYTDFGGGGGEWEYDNDMFASGIFFGLVGLLGLIIMVSTPYVTVKKYQNGDMEGPHSATFFFFFEVLGLGLVITSIAVGT